MRELVVWIAFNITAITVAHFFYKQVSCPLCADSNLDKYIYLKNGEEFDIANTEYTRSEYAHTATIILAFAVTQYYVCNLKERYFDDWKRCLLYMTITLITIPIFGGLGRIKGIDFSFSTQDSVSWTIPSVIIIGIFLVVVVLIFIHEIYAAIGRNFWKQYITAIFLVVGYYIALWIYANNHTTEKIHVHHWFVGLMLTYAIQSNTVYTNILFAIFGGVFLEGATSFSLTNIFTL